MSIAVMTNIWEHSAMGGAKLLLLLAIGDHASDNGVAYPSVDRLAQKIRMTSRNTQYLLKELEQSGELVIERNKGPKGCNLFRVQTLQGAKFSGVKIKVVGGEKSGSKGVKPLSPESSVNIKEPSGPAKQDAVSILEHLNSKAGRKFQPVPANLSLILARLKEGASAEDCRAVIDAKVAKWKSDPKWSEYLRPETLFNASKFASYVGQLGQGHPNRKWRRGGALALSGWLRSAPCWPSLAQFCSLRHKKGNAPKGPTISLNSWQLACQARLKTSMSGHAVCKRAWSFTTKETRLPQMGNS